MTAAEQLAEFSRSISWEGLPHVVRTRATELLVDWAGVTLAGSQLDSSKAATSLLEGDDRRGSSSVLGTGRRALPEVAALLNGTSAHSTELDDVTRESSLHPAVAIIPAALAVAESSDRTFGDLGAAIVAGYEVTIRVGNALGGAAAYRRGFHTTSVAGVFGAAVSSALLMGLDQRGVVNAIGIAGTMASGSLEYVADGAWTKRLNAGWAAHSGVLAAALASAGFSGPRTVLEGRHGALRSFTDSPRPDRLLEDLGDPLLIMTVAVKPYACCRYSHGLIDAVLALRAEENLEPASIRRMRLGVLSAGALLIAEPIEQKRRPHGMVDAQFSAPYAAAVALVEGRAGLPQFNEPSLSDPRIARLMEDIECFSAPELDAVYPSRWPARVEIELRDGRLLSRTIEFSLGEPENWISREGILRKFQDLTDWHPPAAAFRERLVGAEGSESVTAITRVLSS